MQCLRWWVDIADIGGAYFCSRRLYEPLMAARRFGLLERYDYSRQPWFLEECFGKDRVVESVLGRLRGLGVEVSSRAVMNLKRDGRLFRLTFHQKRRARRRKEGMGEQPREKGGLRNYVGMYNRMRADKAGRVFDHVQVSALRGSVLFRFQNEVLGYRFKNQVSLECALLFVADRKDFERLEYTGDILVEIFAKLVGRRALLWLRREVCSRVLENVRQLALSTEGLAFLAIYHKFHHYIDPKAFGTQTQESIAKYAESLRFDLQCRALYHMCPLAPPKQLADVFEAVVGALFVDGGWKAVFEVLHRLLSPLVIYLCLYSELVSADLCETVKRSFAAESRHCFIRS